MKEKEDMQNLCLLLGGVPARTLSPKGVDCEISPRLHRGMKY